MNKIKLAFTLLLTIIIIIPAMSQAAPSKAIRAASNLRVNSDSGLVMGVNGPGTNHAGLRANNQDRPALLPAVANGSRLGTVKQFEETSYYLKDTDFISDNTGWAVGEPHWVTETHAYTGTIIKTTDGGLTWAAEPAGTLGTLRGVDFVDADNGWAVGRNGVILHTSDGGTQWHPQDVPADIEFRYVFFLDAQHGWATGRKTIRLNDWGEEDNWRASVWRTTDGGSTWITGTVPITASVLNRIDFADAQNGWTVGYRYAGDDEFGDAIQKTLILHTHDGGQSWETQFAPDLWYYLTSVDFVDTLNGWAVGHRVFHTTDGGLTWQMQDISSNLWDVHFLDSNRGYVVGLDYIGAAGPPVYRTFNGGATWQRMDLEYEDMEGLFGAVVRENLVLALGDHDFVTRETDPWAYCWGEVCSDLFTQSYINTHYILKDVFFTDESNGWAVGGRSFLPTFIGQVILHTQDGGQTWMEQYSLAPYWDSWNYLYAIYFADAQHGWAVGSSMISEFHGDEHAYLLYTSNGGQTWIERGSELYPAATNIELLDIQFTGPQEGWALSANHHIASLAHTTDGGASWSWVSTGLDGNDLVFGGGLFFADPLHGWIVGGLEDVFYTQDGGNTWAEQDPPTSSNRLHKVAFITNLEGWIVGEAFYHTTDGGDAWSVVDVGLQRDLNAIQFVDDQHGIVAGDRGNILYTENGGASWQFATNDASIATINGLHFITPEKGWLVGDYGTILTTITVPYWPIYLPLVTRDNRLYLK